MSGSSYEEGDIHLRYDGARRLPAETIRLWMETLSRHLATAHVETIVDLGCGTGRFSGALADYFGATVCGVDPSAKMLGVARETAAANPPARGRVRLLEGSAEEIPIGDAVADLVFLSMAYHHIHDKRKACAEFRRVLKEQGRLAIRTTTREQVDSYLWLSFFPEAEAIERRRMPARSELEMFLAEQGFTLDAHESVRQLFATGLPDYFSKISMRAMSSLRAISDEAFAGGLSRLRAYCEARDEAQPVYEEVDLFVFSRS